VPSITLSASAGTWDVGSQVKGPQKDVLFTPESDVITAVTTTPSTSQWITTNATVTNPANAFDGTTSTSNWTILAGTNTPVTYQSEVSLGNATGNTVVVRCRTGSSGGGASSYQITIGGVTVPIDTNSASVFPYTLNNVPQFTEILWSGQMESAPQGCLVESITVNGVELIGAPYAPGSSTTELTLATDQDLTQFANGDAVNQDSAYTPESDTITNVATAVGPVYSSSAYFTFGGSASYNPTQATALFAPGTVVAGITLYTDVSKTATWTPPTPISFTTLRAIFYEDGGTFTINGVDVTSQLVHRSQSYQTITGITSPLTSVSFTGSSGGQGWYGLEINGAKVIDNQSFTTLTFTTDQDLANFSAGDAVVQENSAAVAPDPAFNSTGSGLDLSTVAHRYIAVYNLNGSFGDSGTIEFTGAGLATSPYRQATADTLGPYNYNTAVDQGTGIPTSVSVSGPTKLYFDRDALTGPVITNGNCYVQYSSTPTWNGGDAQSDSSGGIEPRGTVDSVDVSALTMTLASTGTWGPANAGHYVIGPSKTASGTVASTDATALTMTLSSSTGTWAVNAGKYVIGPEKPSANVRLYTVHDAAGAVSDLRSTDPGYVTMAGNSPYTLTFPATFPTGNAPDVDLPAGTSITTEIQATNTAGTDVETSNTIVPS
jgi:hypothetical protein